MESKAKILGHPIHPMLIVFPLGLLISSVIFDVLYLVTDNPNFPVVSNYMIAGGIIGGLVAAIFGLVDYLAIPRQTRAKRVALAHGLGNAAVLILFAISWFIRQGSEDFVPSTAGLILSLLGVATGTVTAWLGGELVDRLGVGVDPGAHLNSPSSLSDQPAAVPPRTAQIPVTGDTPEMDEP